MQSQTIKDAAALALEHTKQNHNWYVLALAVVIFASGITSYSYHRNFDQKEILIAQSISVQREKLESETEMRDLERKISLYNAMAEEHNVKAKETLYKLKSYTASEKAKSESGVSKEPRSFTFAGVLFLILLLWLAGWYIRKEHKTKMKSRGYRMTFRSTVRKFTLGILP